MQDEIIELLSKGTAMCSTTIAEQIGSTDQVAVSRQLGNLKKQGVLKKDSEGLWLIATKGAQTDFPLENEFETLSKILTNRNPKPQPVPEIEVKKETLQRLSLLLDPSIAKVLGQISDDLSYQQEAHRQSLEQ